MSILSKLFKKKPELKITVLYSTNRFTRKAKVMEVQELTSQRGAYEIALDNFKYIRVEIEKK